jgi:hypothetical protein
VKIKSILRVTFAVSCLLLAGVANGNRAKEGPYPNCIPPINCSLQ